MAGFIEGVERGQSTLFPERLEDWVGTDHVVRVVDLFVEELDLTAMGFGRTSAARTGRPGYHPAMLLKLFRRDNGPAIRRTCAQFAGSACCGARASPSTAAKFKAVNNRDRNFTKGKIATASPISRPTSSVTSRRWSASTGKEEGEIRTVIPTR